MTLRVLVQLSLLPLVAACAAVPQASRPAPAPPPDPAAGQVPPQAPPPPSPPPVEAFRAPTITRVPGLDWLFEQDARTLTGVLGVPRLDMAEGDMRKLQFSGEPCVLDIFLYPLRPGAEPVATHVEARRASDGAEVDRFACAQALRQR